MARPALHERHGLPARFRQSALAGRPRHSPAVRTLSLAHAGGLPGGGPLGRRADLLLSGTGQWASQTVPQAPARQDLDSRLLFTDARGRVQLSDRDQIDALFSGSHIRLSDWGVPAGLEALVGRRMSPPLTNAAGFAGLREADRFDSVRAGWTRQTFCPDGPARSRFATASLPLIWTPRPPARRAPRRRWPTGPGARVTTCRLRSSRASSRWPAGVTVSQSVEAGTPTTCAIDGERPPT